MRSSRHKGPPTVEETNEVYVEIEHDIEQENKSDNEDQSDNEMDTREMSESGDRDKVQNDYRKSLLDVDSRQRYRRTRPVIEFLEMEAERNKVTVHELISVVLKQIDYHGERILSSASIIETLKE